VNCFTIESPSEIQRADDLVGMEMPMVPLSCAKAGAPIIDAATPSAKSARLDSVMVPPTVAAPRLTIYPKGQSPQGGERLARSNHIGQIMFSYFYISEMVC
jgi:hypothetical protein